MMTSKKINSKNKRNISARDALKALSSLMKSDDDFAWGWHCNIAMVAFDSGAQHRESNIRAADFMRRVFDIDVSAMSQYVDIIRDSQ